jgi:hypothetical protein
MLIKKKIMSYVWHRKNMYLINYYDTALCLAVLLLLQISLHNDMMETYHYYLLK